MKTKRRCPICRKEIYTGMYCTDCMYKDTSTIPKFEKAEAIVKKIINKNLEKDVWNF